MRIFERLKQLLSESLIYGVAGVLGRFMSIFLVPIYTRFFTPEDYGVMSLVSNSFSLIRILIVFAMSSAAARWYYDSEKLKEKKSAIASWFWQYFFTSIVACILIYIFSDPLGDVIVNREDASLYFKISALSLPFAVFMTIAITLLRLKRQPVKTLIVSVTSVVINIGAALLLVVYYRIGLQGVYYAVLIQSVVTMVISLFIVKDWINPSFFNWKKFKEMFAFALPIVPGTISYWIINLSSHYFIQMLSTTREVGLYQIGSALASGIALVTSAFQQAWGPFAYSIYKEEGAKDVYKHVLIAYMLVIGTLCLGLGLFSPEILVLLTTPKFYGAYWVAAIQSYNYLLIGLTYIATIGTGIAKNNKPYGQAMTVSAILLIGLNLLLVPLFSKEGSAIAVVLAQSIVPVYIFYRAQKMYHIPYNFSKAALIFFLSMTFSLTGLFISLQITSFIIKIIFKLMVIVLFVVSLLYFRVFDYQKVYNEIMSRARKKMSKETDEK